MIADDEVEIRKALETLIAGEESLELVGLAGDAAEAIELARLHRPDVALIDFRMPAGGGPRAAREIGSCSPQTRVVALSAYEDRGSVFQMLRAGAAGYLVKGAPAEEILEAIRRSTQGQGVLSSEVAAEVVQELAGRLERQEDEEKGRRERVRRIRRVLEGDALSMVFQPIVELATGRVVGFEALARFAGEPWQAPDLWFEEAASVGLQTDLELAAARRALTCVESLPDDVYLSINVSPGALISPSVLEAFSKPPLDHIVIEVTETAPIEDYEALNYVLVELRARGGRLAIDDAGAGFASLRHVLRLSPDMIKIDCSLIRGIETERAARALTSALVSFALELGQTVIAEGIENRAAVDALRALGVRYGQGYYLGRPGDLPVRS